MSPRIKEKKSDNKSINLKSKKMAQNGQKYYRNALNQSQNKNTSKSNHSIDRSKATKSAERRRGKIPMEHIKNENLSEQRSQSVQKAKGKSTANSSLSIRKK